jgi:hypothetical protein
MVRLASSGKRPPQPRIRGRHGDPLILVLGVPMGYDPCGEGGEEGEGRRRVRVTALITSGCVCGGEGGGGGL